MHESRDVDVYLLCGSRPIIEDCVGVRFAPLPEHYVRFSAYHTMEITSLGINVHKTLTLRDSR